jgi:MFS family permease
MRRFILVLCLASCGWGFSFGAGAPLASLWLKDAGCSDGFIGLNTGSYYLGIAIAAGFIPWSMRRFRRGSLITGLAAAAMTVAIFPWAHGTVAWFCLRILNGFAAALSIIPMETLINRHSTPTKRSQNFGYYAFSMAIGIAAGELLGLQLYSSTPRLAFVLGGLGALLAGIAVQGWLLWPTEIPEGHEQASSLGLRRNFLCFGSAWSQGFLEGGMMGLMPVYLLALGLSDAGIGWMMSGVMLGVIAFQVPVAWLADRLDRRAILLACNAATLSALAIVLWGVGLIGLALCLFAAAACSTAFYPLGLSLLGQRVPLCSHDKANAWYLGINCLGSLTGPALSGLAMDRFGNQALIASGIGAVLFVLVVGAGLHAFRKRTVFPIPALEARRAA